MDSSVPGRWPEDKANAWYDALPWLVGCNYYPATAINQIEMSREHAQITLETDGFTIQDLGSMNGTFVNEEQITDPVPLVPGDEVRFGLKLSFVFEIAQ